MAEKTLLDEAATITYKKLDGLGGDPQKLPLVLQPVAILYTVQAMIDNGGFRYIFESDYPFTPPYTLFSEAYRLIGANDAADRLDEAVAFFPFTDPHKNALARNEFMDSLPEDHELFVLGDAVCGDDRVWLLMEDYVRSHREAFGV